MKDLLAAIVADNRDRARQLLIDDPVLAKRLVSKPRLYRSGIFHWLYAKDTALHLAAAGYRTEIARLLLDAGADPNASSNHRGGRPLHYAADGYLNAPCWDPRRQVEMIQCLLHARAMINAQDKNGATPLHRAVRTRCAAAVRCLLHAGADPLLKNKPGSTPFHLAVQNTGRGGTGTALAIAAQKQIIDEFLESGLSPDLRTAGGKSVWDCAGSDSVHEWLTVG